MTVLIGMVLGAAAAAAFGSGTFLQHAAVDESGSAAADGAPRPGLVALLTRAAGRGRWWAGQALSTLGGGLQTGALAVAPASTVTPVVSAGIPVALLLASVHRRERPKARQAIGTVACLVGIAVFVTFSHPQQRAHPHLGVVSALSLLAGAVAAALIARHAPAGALGGALAGASSGTATGIALVAAASTFADVPVHGLAGTAFTFAPYVAAVAFFLGTAATQQAFARGELRWSLPATSLASTTCATTLSTVVLGTRLAADSAPVWLLGAVLAIAGVVLTSAADG